MAAAAFMLPAYCIRGALRGKSRAEFLLRGVFTFNLYLFVLTSEWMLRGCALLSDCTLYADDQEPHAPRIPDRELLSQESKFTSGELHIVDTIARWVFFTTLYQGH